MAPLSQAVDEAESLDSDMTDPDAGPSVEEATKEIEGYLLGLHIGSAGRNARVVRRARNHYWFLRGTFPDLPQERLAEACLAVSENLSLVEYPVGRGPVPGHDTDLLCDALGVTTPPETQSKATDTGEG